MGHAGQSARDVGATEFHRLAAADVYSAPTFDQIAPELVSH